MGFWEGSLKKLNHVEGLAVEDNIKVEVYIIAANGEERNGSVQRYVDGSCEKDNEHYGFQKMRGISTSAEEVPASEDGPSCMQFASSFSHKSS